MKRRAMMLGLAVAALALIGVGAWMIYPPAGFLSVGLLVWLDLCANQWLAARPRGGAS